MSDDATQAKVRLTAELGPLVARLMACAEDPMWADHAEVPKALLRRAAEALEETAAIAEHFMAQRDAERERCAAWVDARRDAFCEEHGSIDPDTGALEFGRGAHAEAKSEYVGELEEIAAGLRAPMA